MIFRFQRNWERKWSDKNDDANSYFWRGQCFCIFFTWFHQQVFLRVWRWLVKTEVGSTFLPRQLRLRCDPCHVGIRNRHPQNQGRHLKSWETEQMKRSDSQWQMVMQHLSLAQTNPFTRVSNKWRRGRKTWAPRVFSSSNWSWRNICREISNREGEVISGSISRGCCRDVITNFTPLLHLCSTSARWLNTKCRQLKSNWQIEQSDVHWSR